MLTFVIIICDMFTKNLFWHQIIIFFVYVRKYVV